MPYPLLLHTKHAPGDVEYVSLGEWVVPWRFTTFTEEYEALRRSVGLIDYSTKALLEITGADRAAFLHNLLTNDIKHLRPGQGAHAALLTANAKLVAELIVLVDADRIWMLVDAPRAARVAQVLTQYVFSEQVTVTNHERRVAILALEGPRAIEAATYLNQRVIALPQLGDHVTLSLEEGPVRVVRWSLTGDVGVFCLVEAPAAPRLWARLLAHGHAFALRRVGWEALNAARIEAGIPWTGLDMDETNLLSETGLERTAASDTKGCYLGQEIVARMSTYGSASKKLMGLVVDGEDVPAPGDWIVRAHDEVGRLTSTCHSPALDRPIALGYLKRGAYEPGTTVEIKQNGRRVVARVVERPLVPPRTLT